jgi:hypothetical protein
MSARCRTCAAPILWARTTNGKNIPLDAEPVESGNVYLVANGRETTAIVMAAGEAPPAGVTRRFVSHFVTCAQAAEHRRRKAAQ